MSENKPYGASMTGRPSDETHAERTPFAALLALAALQACTGDFQVADASVEPDAARESDAASEADASGDAPADQRAVLPDAAAEDESIPLEPGRIDVTCTRPWHDLPDPLPADCIGRRRRVFSVEDLNGPESVAFLGKVSVAVQGSGPPVFAFQNIVSIEASTVHLRRLERETLTLGGRADVPNDVELLGESMEIAAEGDTVHLAYWLRGPGTGDAVVYRRWLPDGLLTDGEFVSTNVSGFGSVSLAVSGNDVSFGYHDFIAGTHRLRFREAGGTFSDPILLLEEEPSSTASVRSIAVGRIGRTTHVALRRRDSATRFTPLYRQYIGFLSSFNTIDNVTQSRASGLQLDLAARGDTAAVAYHDWNDGTVELRVATGLELTDQEVSVLETTSSEEVPLQTKIAIAYDDAGRLNVVAWTPSRVTTVVCYFREPTRPGGTRWLSDIVEILPPGRMVESLDLAMGPNRQPHIVYTTGSTLTYATIEP
ncbi:MAG: hypothetical protein AAF938_15230 [Myxococcota bacterium]